MKTNQEIFDIVATHLLKQDFQCKDGLSCQYRGFGGTRCAVGCIINDQQYNVDMEGYTVDDIIAYLNKYGPNPVKVEGVERSAQLLYQALLANNIDCEQSGTLKLLGDLQQCHDAFPPAEWLSTLAEVANNHSLKFKQP